MRRLLGLPAWALRASAQVLVLALAVAALEPVLHGVHVEECEPSFVLHDESDHRFAAADADSRAAEGDHCVACHFARSSRGPVSWEPSGLIPLDTGVMLSDADGRLTTAPSAAPLPARAPPVRG